MFISFKAMIIDDVVNTLVNGIDGLIEFVLPKILGAATWLLWFTH